MYLTETQEQVRDMARAFADEMIRPMAEELDREERFPVGLYDEMAKLGLFGIGVPEELGGPGFDTLTYALVMEELSRGYASVADQCGLIELISTLLVRHGTESQQAMLP
ncbi:MAG: acyl-CoA dehydrogenase family protein, partial [Ensifer adhaerens]